VSEEDFLGRWARRKREARRAEAAPPAETAPAAPPPAEPQEAAPPDSLVADMARAVAPEPPAFDLTALPPIEDITAQTDITGFLQQGVPLDLSRAALRRAWSADPTIRDFIGLAENAWDFNDPTAMPGFGPLDYSPAQLAELVGQIVGGVQRITDTTGAESAPPAPAVNLAGQSAVVAPDAAAPPPDPASAAPGDAADANVGPAASLASDTADSGVSRTEEEPPTRRPHGGALPV
jgi:hypothetical protein